MLDGKVLDEKALDRKSQNRKVLVKTELKSRC